MTLKRTFQMLTILSLIAVAGLLQASPVDLSTWTVTDANLPGGQGNSDWIVSADGTWVNQDHNCDPTYFTNNLPQSEYLISGTWECTTGSDDDFIGFTFGWQDVSHCYILDWKEIQQSAYGAFAAEGLTVKRLAAPTFDDLTLADFWTCEGTEHTEILATHHGSGFGWEPNTLYTFTLDFKPGEFRIIVAEGATVLWDVTVNDSYYTNGEFGFYNFSQNDVVYSGFDQNIDPHCDAGGPYAGDSGVPMLFDGSGSYDEDGQIVAWEWDFGDGSTGSGETVEHTYAEDGEYLVTLCVTDDAGVTVCCETGPVVPNEETSWGELKSIYR